MEFKTISDIENPLFNRREIEGEIHADVTPSRQDVAKMLSEKFSVPAENIKIRTILGKFGSKVFIINANIYSSKVEKDRVEIKKKKDVESEKKTEDATKVSKEAVEEGKSAETSSEEPKQEETKEEKVKEEKPIEERKEEEKVGEQKTEEKVKEEKPADSNK